MKSKKVLIVDHNDLNRRLFENLIGQLYSFDAVRNGVEAVEIALREKFDLIVMDVQMPGMDGVTALKVIRRQSVHQCPIIATTSYSAESAKKCFLEMGFDDLITKPINPKNFLNVISANLSTGKIAGSQLEEGDQDILDKKVLSQLLKYNPIDAIKSLYVDLLKEFDQSIVYIDAAFREKNQQVLIQYLHTLKGNSGTLGANNIFKLTSEADTKARAQDWESLEIALINLKNERILFEKYLQEETTFSP